MIYNNKIIVEIMITYDYIIVIGCSRVCIFGVSGGFLTIFLGDLGGGLRIIFCISETLYFILKKKKTIDFIFIDAIY